jgi:hypothetical protein
MPQPINKKTPGALETKRISFLESKLAPSESDAGVMEFSGYGAVFSNVDSYGDAIEKGAFSNYLADVASGKQEWPAMLTQHGGWGVNASDLTPVGVYSDQKEDDFGLKVTGVLAETPRGLELNTLMKMKPRPAISGLSIGYYAREIAYGGKSDPYERLLKQIDLVEISIVTFPANGKARVSGVKSSDDMSERDFEQLLRDSGLSRKEALIVISKGFRALLDQRDSEADALKQLTDSIKQNTQYLRR